MATALPKGVKRALEIEPKKAAPQRKARKQIEGAAPSRSTQPEGSVYNIWYHKWAGGESYRREIVHAPTRCNPKRDSGLTRAIHPTIFCLHFAKGCCNKGYECAYLHRVPTVDDPVETTVDCFGRDRFRDSKSDMGGIGGFDRENRTLYVGKIQCSKHDIENIVHKHFGQFGKIERLRCLHAKKVAFVTYFSRSSAEFAKEAMMEQSLDDEEILNVRWACEDPAWFAKRAIYEKAVDDFTQKAIEVHPAELDQTVEDGPLADDETTDDAAAANGAADLTLTDTATTAKGLLSATTMQMLSRPPAPIEKQKKAAHPLAGLAAYGSDSDSD